jgi:signal peptidase I
LHIEQKDGSVEHYEFLASGEGDPRVELLKAMKKVIGDSGDVVVFNQTFEIGRLKELAEDYPEHEEWIQNVLDRIVDLAIPFKNYYYYDPSQKGRYSIKKVLPAVTGKSYDGLDINNGGDASARYYYSHIDKRLDGKEKIRKNLLKYCKLDTESMIWIIGKLKEITN